MKNLSNTLLIIGFISVISALYAFCLVIKKQLDETKNNVDTLNRWAKGVIMRTQ